MRPYGSRPEQRQYHSSQVGAITARYRLCRVIGAAIRATGMNLAPQNYLPVYGKKRRYGHFTRRFASSAQRSMHCPRRVSAARVLTRGSRVTIMSGFWEETTIL